MCRAQHLRGLLRWHKEHEDLVVVLSGVCLAGLLLAGWQLGLIHVRNYWLFGIPLAIAGFSVLRSIAKLGWLGKALAARLWWKNGMLHWKVGRREEAKRCFEKAQHFDQRYAFPKPRPSKYQLLLSEAEKYFMEIHDHEAAISLLRQAVNLKPERADAYFALGVIYEARHDDDEAMSSYTKAIELAPNRDEYSYARGALCLFAYFDFGGAIDDLSQAIRINHKYAEAYCLRAEAYFRLGDETSAQKAREDLARAQTLSPKGENAKRLMEQLIKALTLEEKQGE